MIEVENPPYVMTGKVRQSCPHYGHDYIQTEFKGKKIARLDGHWEGAWFKGLVTLEEPWYSGNIKAISTNGVQLKKIKN